MRTPSSSNGSATSWATGGCACCHRGAAGSMLRGAWRWPVGSVVSSASRRNAVGRRRLRRSFAGRGCDSRFRIDADRSGRGRVVGAATTRRNGAVPARFRENAGRSLLLPKRRAGSRAPLWQQRKKAGDLLAVAARFGSFPVVLETYRECLRDIFDMPALVDTLLQVPKRAIKVVVVDPETPSPFAASLLFG